MAKKSINDIVMKGGEIHPPRIRGTIEAWIDHKEEHNWKEDQGTIPVDVDRGLKSDAYHNWFSFLNGKVEEPLHEVFDEEDEKKLVMDIFYDYWDSNEELRHRFKEIAYWCTDASMLINVNAAEEQGGIENLIEEHGTSALAKAAYKGRQYVKDEDFKDSGDEEKEHKDQSSHGASVFPQLHDIGVVDDYGNIRQSKLRGLVIAFTKDVEQIMGESREFEVKWAQHAFLYWGKEKFDDEWIEFASSDAENGDIYEAVEWLYENDDESASRMEKKFRGNYDIEVGNPDTDDVLEAFLEAEVPGWNEEEDDEETTESKSKWEQFEEDSQELETETKETQRNGGKRETESKWEQYEKQSKEASSNGLGPDDPDGQGEGDSDDDSDTGSSSDDAASPNDLGDWADSEGTTDDIHSPPRTRAKGKSEDGETTQQSKSKDVQQRQTTAGTTDVECEDGGRPYPIQWPDVEPIDEFERNRVYEGNTFEWALKLPRDSVDTVVTSPPYYALRDYDIEDAFPISGDFTCDHDWQDEFCTKCGAFLGQLGHEPDPATFVEHIVDLMDRYKRVLKPTGSLWLNIGDTYAGNDIDGRVKAKRKSRMMIPERVYRRMVQTGWHLRDYVIWVKKIWMPDDDLRGNGKPFAGSSRLADQWEPMVRFTPEADHYSDVDSNRLLPPSFDGDLGSKGIEGKFREGEDTQRGKTYNELGTNPPDVWLINSDGYQGDHRAVFPEELPKRCINITTPDRVCSRCGIPFEKEVHVEDGNKLSPGGDYATYERKCHCDADHKPGVAFDPFLGSGTTAVAAANNGYDWAGVELSEKYQELARKRIPTGRQVGITDY